MRFSRIQDAICGFLISGCNLYCIFDYQYLFVQSGQNQIFSSLIYKKWFKFMPQAKRQQRHLIFLVNLKVWKQVKNQLPQVLCQIIYQFFYRMESLQLRNIQNIENSLSLLKLKIQSMSKLNSQKEQALDKLVLSTIPVVQKKLKQNQIKVHSQQKKTYYLQRSSSMKKRNEESRLINEKEISRSRQLLTLMKHHNSLHLKESKKHNEERIKKIKEISLIKKREHRFQIKKRQQETQAKIQHFHMQKQLSFYSRQSDIKLRRLQQAKENQERIETLMNKLKDLAQKEQLMQQKIRTSDENISRFKKVINKVQKMKCGQFNKFRQQVIGIPQQKANSKCISQALLMYAASKNN